MTQSLTQSSLSNAIAVSLCPTHAGFLCRSMCGRHCQVALHYNAGRLPVSEIFLFTALNTNGINKYTKVWLTYRVTPIQHLQFNANMLVHASPSFSYNEYPTLFCGSPKSQCHVLALIKCFTVVSSGCGLIPDSVYSVTAGKIPNRSTHRWGLGLFSYYR